MPWEKRKIKGREIMNSIMVIKNNSVQIWTAFLPFMLYNANISQEKIKIKRVAANDSSIK